MSDSFQRSISQYKKLWEIVFENNPNAMWLSDPEGNLLLINRACLELLKLKPEEVIGKYNVLKDNIVEEQGKMSLVRSVFDEKKTVNFELYYDSSLLYLSWENPVQVILDVTISPVLDADGNLIHALIMHKDLTQQRAYENLLKHNEAEKKTILDSLPDYVSFFDLDYRYQWANKAFLDSINMSLDEIIGEKCYNVIWNRDVPCGNCRIPEILDTRSSIRYNTEDRRGSIRDTIAIPVIENNEIYGFVEIARDITEQIDSERKQKALERQIIEERVKSEQAVEMERLKTSFMSTATHEIKTPLTSILGYIELIDISLKGDDMDSFLKYYEILKRNAERLSLLTENLLDLQRIDSKRIDLSKTYFDITGTIAVVLDELAPLYKEKNITIISNYDISNNILYADKARIQQVLVNLLSNSIKFSPHSSVISLHVTETEDSHVFSVKDDGIGFTEEEKKELFKPFPDIDPQVKGKGSGLGLSICKGIVELHGGRIWTESDGISTGSIFSFTIPKNGTNCEEN